MCERLDLPYRRESTHFHTLAGFILTRLHRVPVVGESITYEGYNIFEVLDLDGSPIDKVLVRRG